MVIGRDGLRLGYRLVGFGPAVVECDLHADLARILAAAGEVVPLIALPATADDDVLEVYPRLANEVGLFVVVEHGNFELVVVRAIVNDEAQLLVPAQPQVQVSRSSRLERS